jgi:hypothetical protein
MIKAHRATTAICGEMLEFYGNVGRQPMYVIDIKATVECLHLNTASLRSRAKPSIFNTIIEKKKKMIRNSLRVLLS